MNVVADHFADCAEILKNAGYDMVLLHGGGGCYRGATWRSWVTWTAA